MPFARHQGTTTSFTKALALSKSSPQVSQGNKLCAADHPNRQKFGLAPHDGLRMRSPRAVADRHAPQCERRLTSGRSSPQSISASRIASPWIPRRCSRCLDPFPLELSARTACLRCMVRPPPKGLPSIQLDPGPLSFFISRTLVAAAAVQESILGMADGPVP